MGTKSFLLRDTGNGLALKLEITKLDTEHKHIKIFCVCLITSYKYENEYYISLITFNGNAFVISLFECNLFREINIVEP